jgi:type 1 glutamine amidotransferase
MKLPSTILACTLGLVAFASVASAAPKKLLVVTVTAGFRHGPAIEAAEKVLPEIAAKSAGEFTFDFLSEPGPKPNAGPKPVRGRLMSDVQWADEQAKYKAAEQKAKAEQVPWNQQVKELFATKLGSSGLAHYDGVIFCNTTGDLPLPDGDALVNWVKSGKAFIGMHAATDTLKNLQSYYQMINGSFAGHPWGGGGTYTFANHEPSHPAAAMFPAEFQWKDEIYQYTHFDPNTVRVLISIDIAKSQPQAPYHVPVSWVRPVGDGRLFYTNLGHNASSWTDETYQKHITAGIRWALKLIEGPAEPNPAVSAQQGLKSIVATAASHLKTDAAALEAKALAKAKTDPAWAARIAAEGDSYRSLPSPRKEAPPAEIEKASAAKISLLQKLVAEIEK